MAILQKVETTTNAMIYVASNDVEKNCLAAQWIYLFIILTFLLGLGYSLFVTESNKDIANRIVSTGIEKKFELWMR